MLSFLPPLIRPGSVGKPHRFPFPGLDAKSFFVSSCGQTDLGVYPPVSWINLQTGRLSLQFFKLRQKAVLWNWRGRSSAGKVRVSAVSPFSCSLPTGGVSGLEIPRTPSP